MFDPIENRFIPACAGNTQSCRPSCRAAPVHPRVCGEHELEVTHADLAAGSSPRVRGTLDLRGYAQRNHRFIPACAGNTSLSDVNVLRLPVHPRVCGEHATVKTQRPIPLGSSPRVRGTPQRPLCMKFAIRFIPACAGNTRASEGPQTGHAVHPRVCGEHSGAVPAPVATTGSSPRVRGTQRARIVDWLRIRFIPACAGNTRRAPSGARSLTVHPRVCGEHQITINVKPTNGGSSPRVRGTR